MVSDKIKLYINGKLSFHQNNMYKNYVFNRFTMYNYVYFTINFIFVMTLFYLFYSQNLKAIIFIGN